MQIIGREFAAAFAKLGNCRLMRTLAWMHASLRRKPAALHEIARAARGDDVLPRRASAPGAWNQVIESEVFGIAAILAFEAITQKDIEASEGWVARGLDIGLERHDRR